jgi:hypothetical protein
MCEGAEAAARGAYAGERGRGGAGAPKGCGRKKAGWVGGKGAEGPPHCARRHREAAARTEKHQQDLR